MKNIYASEHGLISKDEAVLLVIDMQERLFPVVADKERLLENVIRLVRFSQIVDLPLLFTEQEKLGATLPEIREYLGDIELITKIEFDCFANKAFADKIRRLNRKALIITGIEAHICVAQTALHGVSGYSVHVVSDGTSSRSPHNCQIGLQRMNQGGVTVSSTEMVIYELLGKAGTDTFKEVLKLVK